ncbi:MAG: hypothetical protein JWQ98_1985 [Chlorobi bacterium]|jgi:hypothetical protein|nr:hypothetical protein [Chlorobiota bacterium]
MTNFSLSATLADGQKVEHSFHDCHDLIQWLAGYGIVPDISSAEITVRTDDGKTVHITIPNDDSMEVRARIDDEPG